MWSEEQDNMDNRIRKAADSMPHPIDDRHWEKMATLLDEHLPEEKKRRRFFFILLLAGLLTGAGIITMLTFSKKQSTADKLNETTVKLTIDNKETKPVKAEKNNTTGHNNAATDIVKQDETSIIRQANSKITGEKNSPLVTSTIKKKKENTGTKKPIQEHISGEWKTIAVKENDNKTSKMTGLINNESGNDNFIPSDAAKDSSSQNTIAAILNTETEEETKADSINVTVDTLQEKSTPKNKQSKFSVLLSAGSDISGIGIKAGSPQITYGIGIAYTLSDKWTIRIGVLAAIKKYGAKPQQYHPDNYNFWVYYPNMQKIDANCLVYEIPLSIIYNFKTSGQHNWFVSTGVSSFLMKRETYDYTYKDNWGQTRYTTRTYKNEYRHWLAVMSISGGYQYRFSNKLSLLAEPYIKMPLTGVGFGHVKLNSAGILVTAVIKPFSKKEK